MLNPLWDHFHVALLKTATMLESLKFSQVYAFTMIITTELELKIFDLLCDSIFLDAFPRVYTSYIILNGFTENLHPLSLFLIWIFFTPHSYNITKSVKAFPCLGWFESNVLLPWIFSLTSKIFCWTEIEKGKFQNCDKCRECPLKPFQFPLIPTFFSVQTRAFLVSLSLLQFGSISVFLYCRRHCIFSP